MGVIRLALGAGIVGAIVMAGEADMRGEALHTVSATHSAATTAVEFCRDQPQVCAAAASAGLAASLGAGHSGQPTPPKRPEVTAKAGQVHASTDDKKRPARPAFPDASKSERKSGSLPGG